MNEYADMPLYFRIYKKISSVDYKRIINTVLNVIFVALTVFFVVCFVLGYRVMFIMSPSMEPVIKTHQFVIGERYKGEDLNVGDIITYQPANKDHTVTHRIIEETEGGYIVKGDNNKYADKNVVTEDMILYKVIAY